MPVQVITFDYTGAEQLWVVPAGITSVTLECWGAQGGVAGTTNPNQVGGKGGYAKGDLAVTPGETLRIYVGKTGSAFARISVFGGGGKGGYGPTAADDGGGGGGASDVRQGGSALGDRKIVAGGGGGAGQGGSDGGVGGAGGGTSGTAGHTPNAGAGGTASAGGAAGSGGSAGGSGVGGNGGGNSDSRPNNPSGGGGAGGGYFGGGGGGGGDGIGGGGGGGGSGYVGGVTTTTLTADVKTGDGQVKITVANVAPNTPTLTDPINAKVIDKDISNRFSWIFSDPNSTDTQSAYDLRYRIGAGAWTDLSATTADQFRDIAGATFTADDYEWQVRTTDDLGLVGAYSAGGFFTAATKPATPSITDPTTDQVLTAATYQVVWTSPTHTSYQLRTVADAAGSPDTGTVYTDSGEVVSAADTAVAAFNTNSRFEHIQVRVKADGLWSDWASKRVEVDYATPTVPTLVATEVGSTVSVAVTNPPPTTEPAVTGNDVYVRVKAGGLQDLQRTVDDDGIRIAANIGENATHIDRSPASGVIYEYRIKAYGNNGTFIFGAWTE